MAAASDDAELEQLFHSDLQSINLQDSGSEDTAPSHLPEWLIGVIIIVIILILVFFAMIIYSLIKERKKRNAGSYRAARPSDPADREWGEEGAKTECDTTVCVTTITPEHAKDADDDNDVMTATKGTLDSEAATTLQCRRHFLSGCNNAAYMDDDDSDNKTTNDVIVKTPDGVTADGCETVKQRPKTDDDGTKCIKNSRRKTSRVSLWDKSDDNVDPTKLKEDSGQGQAEEKARKQHSKERTESETRIGKDDAAQAANVDPKKEMDKEINTARTKTNTEVTHPHKENVEPEDKTDRTEPEPKTTADREGEEPARESDSDACVGEVLREADPRPLDLVLPVKSDHDRATQTLLDDNGEIGMSTNL